jgi:glycosyltransferase involved in cell wall biosynthesis
MKKVTYIIAHYDCLEYICEAIESAKNQTYPNIGICVIDDASPNQKEVVDTIIPLLFGNEFTTMKDNNCIAHYNDLNSLIFYKDNRKQGYARNRGIEFNWNKTDYFNILDADDINYPTKVEKCVEVLEKYPQIAAVYADYDIHNLAAGTRTREYKEPYDAIRLQQECIVHSGCTIRKTALESVLENGLVFDELLPPCEDYDLWLRLSEKYLLYHIPEQLSLVRVHDKNSTVVTKHNYIREKLQQLHAKAYYRRNGK